VWLQEEASWQEILDSTQLSAERLNQALQSLNDSSLLVVGGEQSSYRLPRLFRQFAKFQAPLEVIQVSGIPELRPIDGVVSERAA
jgi:hypothetical protein